MFIEPGQTKTIKYTVAPEDAGITWTTDSDAYFNYSVDESTKTVTITGKTEGFGRLIGVTQYGNRTTLAVKCSWNYKFSIDKSIIKAEPEGEFVINYDVNPEDATFDISLLKNTSDFINWTIDEQKKQILITPISEGGGELHIIAKNPRDNTQTIGTKICNIKLEYKNLKIKPKIVSQDGRFSHYDENLNRIFLGDGESLGIELITDKPKAFITIKDVIFKKITNNYNIQCIQNGEKEIQLFHPDDIIKKYYKITEETYWNPKFKKRFTEEPNYFSSTSQWSFFQFYWRGNGGFGVVVYESTYFNGIITYSWKDKTFVFHKPELLIKEPLSEPKLVSEEEFKNNINYCIPSATVQPEGYSVINGQLIWGPVGSPEIVPEFILNKSAVLMDNIEEIINTPVIDGLIEVSYLHNGVVKKIKIPVSTEVRPCKK